MKHIWIFIGGCFLGFFVFLILSYFSLPLASPALKNYYVLKDYINQNAPSNKKRLIIMSASDGMYGIVGEIIDKETEYYPINYSMFFGTGLALDFRINKLISILQNGDTLLLPLNYGFYSTKENPRYFSYYQNMLSWGDENFANKYPLLTIQTLLKSPPSKILTGFIQHIIANIKEKHIIDRAKTRWEQDTGVFYSVSPDSLDQYGELRYHSGTPH